MNGAYFDIIRRGDFVYKTLVNKEKELGSKYPDFDLFSEKINLLRKYLQDFVVDTQINKKDREFCLVQPFIEGQDLFDYIEKSGNPKRIEDFVSKLNFLYEEKGILPDLLNTGNVLVTKNGNILIVDVWPLFFEQRIKDEDINQGSYDENLQKLDFLKMQTNLN